MQVRSGCKADAFCNTNKHAHHVPCGHAEQSTSVVYNTLHGCGGVACHSNGTTISGQRTSPEAARKRCHQHTKQQATQRLDEAASGKTCKFVKHARICGAAEGVQQASIQSMRSVLRCKIRRRSTSHNQSGSAAAPHQTPAAAAGHMLRT